MRSNDPVIASKPVAYTMMSTSWSRSVVRIPVGVMRSIGVSPMSTRWTSSRLYAS